MVGEFVCVYVCACTGEWMSEWVSECMSEWVYEWLSERASEWVSECEWVWAQCPTPATQKRRRPRDTGRTWGRTSDPLAVHIAPRLPRKSGGAQGIPEGREGVHRTPWQCTLPHACYAKAAEPKGHRRDAITYIRPLGSGHCPTPATQKQRSPRDTGGTPGRTSDPLAVHIVPRLPRKRDTRAYIRPLAHCPTPAAQKQRSPRDTRGKAGRTSDPLPVHIVPRLPRKSGGAQGTPEGRQGVHPTPWQCTLPHACHARAGEPKGHRRDAITYIQPLGKAHCPTPATQKQRSPRDTGGTPGRTSDPLAVHIAPRLPRKSGGGEGTEGTPEGRQGVHPTPWQRTLSHACHAKAAEPKGHQRDARAYIGSLGSAHLSHACHAKAGSEWVNEWMNEWVRRRKKRCGYRTKNKNLTRQCEEKTVFRDFPTFSHTCIFFLLILSLLTCLPSDSAPVWLFAPLLFHLSILLEVWLLNFLRLGGRLTHCPIFLWMPL